MNRCFTARYMLAGLVLALVVDTGQLSGETVFCSGFEYSDGDPTVVTDAANINGAVGQIGLLSGTLPVGEGSGVGVNGFVTFHDDDTDRAMLLDRAVADCAVTAALSHAVSLQGARVSFSLGLTRTQSALNLKDYWIVGLDSSVRYNGGSTQYFNDPLRRAFHIGMFTRKAGDTYADPKFYRDGFPAVVTGTANGAKTLDLWTYGGTLAGTGRASGGGVPNNQITGEVLELIVYNKELNAVQRRTIGTYQTNKYKLFPIVFVLK